jgi:hypothetical protein
METTTMQDINTLDMDEVSDMIYEAVEELKANGWHEGTDYYTVALKGVAHVLNVDLETLRIYEEDYQAALYKEQCMVGWSENFVSYEGPSDPWNS